jgi:osmoprotectant transport system substrate-binding protein
VDFVPEYLGTVLEFVSGGVAVPGPDPRESHRRLADALRSRGLLALDFARAENRNVIVVRERTAARYGLVTITDLGEVDDRFVFGGPPECPERPLCLKGLERTYGLDFASFLPLDSGGPLTLAALEGREIDVALLFSTSPHVGDPDLRLLFDDRDLQPAENVLPIVRREVVERHGKRFVRLVNSVTHKLTTDALRRLNEQMNEGAMPSAAATEWLDGHGF